MAFLFQGGMPPIPPNLLRPYDPNNPHAPPPTPLGPEIKALYVRVVEDSSALTLAEKHRVVGRLPPEQEDQICMEHFGLTWGELIAKALAAAEELSKEELDVVCDGAQTSNQREPGGGEVPYSGDAAWERFKQLYDWTGETMMGKQWRLSGRNLWKSHECVFVSEAGLHEVSSEELRSRFHAMGDKGEIPEGIRRDCFLVVDEDVLTWMDEVASKGREVQGSRWTVFLRAVNVDYEGKGRGDLGEISVPLPKVCDWLYYTLFAQTETWQQMHRKIRTRSYDLQMRRLLDTLRGRKHRRKAEEPDSEPPLPLLPAQRPRGITPTAITGDQVTTLGTFARLPPELRRRVLRAAFGDRTVHMDLRLSPPPRPKGNLTTAAAAHEHGAGSAPLSFPGTDKKNREWRWYGCVCHRLLPRDSADERRIFTARGVSPYIWPHRDACLRGEAVMCKFWAAGECECAVGALGWLRAGMAARWDGCALGWLRACRMAYAEGVEVLYATNTFVIESRDLLDALLAGRKVILPQRLSAVRELELRLEVLLIGDPNLLNAQGKDKMQMLPDLGGFAARFPGLQSLVVSFSDYLYNDPHLRPKDRLPEIERLLLQPLALMAERLVPQLERPVVVELPSNVFCDLGGLELEEERQGDEWGDGKGTWLRYPVGGSEGWYYVKEGVETDLFWDYQGRGRWLSAVVNHTDPYYVHLT
ncbi:hypothetical protein CMUS01_05818 [Colletotrichum musicola]|uniref:DUF7730 domain-containing protein n=1 Tax=Colletotrichum musicola TaxID=2175873 RepID=A0A8H6NIZ4_9PEZI|nr:hypothetical protein CMUS01_05818 [Colletotrichum musicola]